MTIGQLIESPDILGVVVLVAIGFFALGFMLGDCVGFRDGIRIFDPTDKETE